MLESVLALLHLVMVVVCFLQVAGGASDALLKEEERLFQLQAVCCVVLSGCGPGMARTGVEFGETLHLLTFCIVVFGLVLDL